MTSERVFFGSEIIMEIDVIFYDGQITLIWWK